MVARLFSVRLFCTRSNESATSSELPSHASIFSWLFVFKQKLILKMLEQCQFSIGGMKKKVVSMIFFEQNNFHKCHNQLNIVTHFHTRYIRYMWYNLCAAAAVLAVRGGSFEWVVSVLRLTCHYIWLLKTSTKSRRTSEWHKLRSNINFNILSHYFQSVGTQFFPNNRNAAWRKWITLKNWSGKY